MITRLFYQSWIVKGNISLKKPRAYSIATSPGSLVELDILRALPRKAPRSVIGADYEMIFW